MHALECYARRDDSRLYRARVDEPWHPPERGDPRPPITFGHRDSFSVLQSVAASATEIAVSRRFNGPAIIDECVLIANTVNFITLRVIAGIADSDDTTAGELNAGTPLIDHTFGDTYTTVPIVTGVGTYHRFTLSRRIDRQLFRLRIVFLNASANAVVVSAIFGIQFYNQVYRADCPCDAR